MIHFWGKDTAMKLKRAGLITRIIIILLLIYALITLFGLRSKMAELKAENAALEQQKTELEVQNAELEYKLEHSDDDDVISDIARDELGLVGANDQIYYDSVD